MINKQYLKKCIGVLYKSASFCNKLSNPSIFLLFHAIYSYCIIIQMQDIKSRTSITFGNTKQIYTLHVYHNLNAFQQI